MSEKLGSVRYAGQQLQYLGGVMQDNSQLSPQTQEIIDSEVRRLVSGQLERARELLQEHRQALENLAGKLLAQETVDGSAADEALKSEEAGPGAGGGGLPGDVGDAGNTVAGMSIPVEGQVIAEAPDIDTGAAPGV
jgi:cell division protease FtsH